MVRFILAALGAVFFFSAGAAFANSSVYTDLVFEQCEKVSEYEDGVQLKCDGYEDYPVYFKEGDLREAVFFGKLSPLLIDEGFESFGSFNHVNTKVEWRLDEDGTPVAAILRWFIENVNPETGASDEKFRGQVLVVSRVAQGDEDGLGCVVGYVDALANKDANERAREIADEEALDFACGYNEPMWWGERGEKAGQEMRYLPESLKSE
ncbi:hypothetical protein [Rhizobium sp. L1K21]|uniref:hypothetical protein n=1 Tax=Rhizobium sp. L1K21 TaxID=2954933 RepID=UPI002093BA3C|nr:hypothetical protein [Rhizobium sp. L1K21]MCO6184861.1 hypothetical protein [Rhizobium sp. L1K21]